MRYLVISRFFYTFALANKMNEDGNHVYIQLDYFFRTVFELIIQSNSKHAITQLKNVGKKSRRVLSLANSILTSRQISIS